MHVLLDRLYEDIECTGKEHFKGYYIKASELNSSFIALVKRRKGKIL